MLIFQEGFHSALWMVDGVFAVSGLDDGQKEEGPLVQRTRFGLDRLSIAKHLKKHVDVVDLVFRDGQLVVSIAVHGVEAVSESDALARKYDEWLKPDHRLLRLNKHSRTNRSHNLFLIFLPVKASMKGS
jgi:hypothetical protein